MLALFPLVSSFYINSSIADNSNNAGNSINQNIANGNNGDCLDCDQSQPKICKTWVQDTFDILGHFLDNIMILIGEMEQCQDGDIVVSMWGDDAPVPELNKYGK